MKSSLLITVYITNYNYGRYIKQAIESVLAQTQQNFELLIIDDGSTDDSKGIIEQYRDNPAVSIIYQKNKGLNITNNIALRASKGKYIMRLDADDYIEPNALEVMSGILELDNELGLVFPDYYLTDEDGKILERYQRHDFDKDVSLFDQPAHGACTMIRTDYLRQIGGYNENFKCQDGYDLWIRFIQHYKVKNVNEPLFFYRRHGKNLTKNEDRILSTRAKINFLEIEARFGAQLPSLAIIPVRRFEDCNLQIGDKNLLDWKLEAMLQSKYFHKIVVTSPDLEIANYLEQHYKTHGKVVFHHRTKEKARLNTDLNATIKGVIDQHAHESTEAITVATLEYPFVKGEIFDDAINTMFLFESDSLISVREDNSLMYQHDGTGMKTILNQGKFTKLERESLYRHVGGITCIKKSVFEQTRQMTTNNIGHIVISQSASLGVFSEVDLKIADLWAQNHYQLENSTVR